MPMSIANRHAQSKDPVPACSGQNPSGNSRHGRSPVRPQIPQQLVKLTRVGIVVLPLAEVWDVVFANLGRQILSLVGVEQIPLPRRLTKPARRETAHACVALTPS